MGNMKLGANGARLIKNYEGLRLTAYKPVAAEPYYTIGYGHMGPDVKRGMVITKERADQLFLQDVKRFEAAVNQFVTVPLNQNQFDALVSFAYNVGVHNFKTSSVARFLNQRRYDLVPARLNLWVRGANNVVLAGLVRRRREEGQLFQKGTGL